VRGAKGTISVSVLRGAEPHELRVALAD